MKKTRIFYTLALVQAIFTAQAADYTGLFESARQRHARFENKGTEAVSFIVLSNYMAILGPKEVKTFTTDEGFSYIHDGKRYRKFVLNNEANDTMQQHALPYPQMRGVNLSAGESVEFDVNHLSYFTGIRNIRGLIAPKENISFEMTKKGLEVDLGTMTFQQPKYRQFQRYLDEIVMLSSLYEEKPDAMDIFAPTQPNSSTSIPKINHRLWLNPSFEAPLVSLERFVENTKSLDDSWQYYFWCIDKTSIPETLKYLKEKSPYIKIKELKEITNGTLWPNVIFDGLMNDSYYTIASNIARIFILFTQGGVYCDLGTEIFKEIDMPLSQFQHIFATRMNSKNIIEGFMASYKNSQFLQRVLLMWVNLRRLSYEYIKAIDLRNYAGVSLLSSECFYPHIYFLKKTGGSYIITYEGALYKFNSLRSWHSEGLYGNKKTQTNKIISSDILRYSSVPMEQLEKDTYGTLISDYSRARCGLVEMIDKHFYSLSYEEIVARRLAHHQKACSLYLDSCAPQKKTMPHIQHRIWLTAPDNPFEVPTKLLESVKNSLQYLHQDFQTIFWFNTPDLLPETMEWIHKNIPNAQIKNTHEISENMRGKEIFDILYGLNRFANAGILLRYNILNQFGGIYADMGTLLRGDIETAVDKFDYMFSQRDYYLTENWLDVNFMASKPNAQLWENFFNFIESLKTIKENHSLHPDFYTLKRYMPIDEDHAWISGHALSAAIDATLTEDDAILPMNFNSLFKSGSTGSWIGQTKFGSNSVRTHKYKFV